MIPILILAAGQSSRMGARDKLLEPVQGEPLLRKQVRMACATGQPVFSALPPAADARLAAIADLDATALIVPEAKEGLSGTMRGAMVQLPDAPAYMMILGDLVALERSDLDAVLGARRAHPGMLIWRGATQDGAPGHPIIFDNALRPEFAKLRGDDGARALVQRHMDRTCLVRLPQERARFDLDTPQAWDAWRKSIR